MYEHVRATNGYSVLFFVSLVIIGNFILLNLFLAILLKNFEEEEEEEKEEKKTDGVLKGFSNKIKNILTFFKRSKIKDESPMKDGKE
jgi:hypothetical protein